jgi:hypothetical protein
VTASRPPLKRTRPAEYLRKQAAEREREQRRLDQQVRRLVSWGRSK